MVAAKARRIFDEDFKSKAVQRVLDGETLQAVADDIGVHVNVLRGWRQKGGPEATPATPRDTEDLARENALLRAEIDYLRKREAIFRR